MIQMHNKIKVKDSKFKKIVYRENGNNWIILKMLYICRIEAVIKFYKANRSQNKTDCFKKISEWAHLLLINHNNEYFIIKT